MLKGGIPGAGLKGLEDSTAARSPAELRDAPPESAGPCAPNQEASTVDLCGRDPAKPVDPRRLKVTQRALDNASYNRGFDEIRSRDFDAAVAHFKKAGAQLGPDPLVRNALALAEDLRRVEREKARTDAARVASHEATWALLSGNDDEAVQKLRLAAHLDPAKPHYRARLGYVQAVHAARTASEGTPHADKRDKALTLARIGYASVFAGDWDRALDTLEAALRVDPGAHSVRDMIAKVKEMRERELGASATARK